MKAKDLKHIAKIVSRIRIYGPDTVQGKKHREEFKARWGYYPCEL